MRRRRATIAACARRTGPALRARALRRRLRAGNGSAVSPGFRWQRGGKAARWPRLDNRLSGRRHCRRPILRRRRRAFRCSSWVSGIGACASPVGASAGAALAPLGAKSGSAIKSAPCAVARWRRVWRSMVDARNRTDPSASSTFPPPGWLLHASVSIQLSIRRAVPKPPANHGPPSVASATIAVPLAPSTISLRRRLLSNPSTPRVPPGPCVDSAPVIAT